jgi:transcriptional regulator GlxA family with amidase domain
MTSVGTGSLVYASAGLLAHRPATTHWASLDLLAELDATIDVRRDEWFVDDGDVVASAGISAGITWRCTSSSAWPEPTVPARHDEASNMAPHRRSGPAQLKGTRMQTASETSATSRPHSACPTPTGV